MFDNSNKTILVTGCAGFIGSNFVPYFLDKYQEYNVVNLVYHTGKKGNVYNIAGKNERTNLQIVDKIYPILDENFGMGIAKTIEYNLKNMKG